MQALVDTNVWVALTIRHHDSHQLAREWFVSLPETDEMIFCRSTQQSLLRMLTLEALWRRYGVLPMTNHEALAELDRLLAIDAIRLLEEPADLQGHWRSYAGRHTSSPNLWMDAYLAAFAVAGGMQMVTMDTGFRQFDGLDVLILETA